MSSHCIAAEPHEVIVGWDPPLQTYFLQIIDPAKGEEEELLLWLGTAAVRVAHSGEPCRRAGALWGAS